MSRTMLVEIKNCFDCNQLKTHDGFASHRFECPHLNKWSKQVDDPKGQKAVIKELDGWFKVCPKWNLTTAST